MKEPILVIMAAGLGSRYHGLKQLDSVGPTEEVLLDYAIYDALQSGFKRVILVIRHDFEDKCKEITGGRWHNKIQVDYAYQELDTLPLKIETGRTKPWGTGHALLSCKNLIDAPFAIINADDYYGRSAFQSIFAFLKTNPKVNQTAMIGYKLKNTLSPHGSVTRGICGVDSKNNVVSVDEISNITLKPEGIFYKKNEKDLTFTGNEWASMNFWGYSANIIPLIENEFMSFLEINKNELKAEFLLPTMMNTFIQKKLVNLTLLESNSRWFGMTYSEDRQKVKEEISALIAENFYPHTL